MCASLFRRSPSRRRSPRARTIRPQVESLQERVLPAHLWYYPVTNINNSGPGSLRQAILDANQDSQFNPFPGQLPDLINFAIPLVPGAPFPPVINLLSPLPVITDDVEIIGETELLPPQGILGGPPLPLPPVPGIELNGAAAGFAADGLTVAQSYAVVSGFVIHDFSHDGVFVNNGANNVYLHNCRIGTDASGSVPHANGGDGVFWGGNNGYLGVFPQAIVSPIPGFLPRGGVVDAGHPVYQMAPIIGMAGSANVISANRGDGVLLTGNNNLVAGNFIGTDPAATLNLGNGKNGVHVNGGNNNAIGQIVNGQPSPYANAIQHNGPAAPAPGSGDGVLVDAGGFGDSIEGNSLSGNTRLPIELLNDANLFQTSPSFVRVTTASPRGTNDIEVDGIAGGTPDTTYVVDVYVDRAITDTAGDVRNGVFLGEVNAHVASASSGGAAFQLVIPAPFAGVLTGLFSATVTDPGGNTSQYSPAFQGAEAPASIEGQVFQDVHASGQKDPGDGGLNGWTVQVMDETNQVVRAVQTQSLDLNGDGQIDPVTETGIYQFTNLLPLHHYTVREVPQVGAQQTFPTAPGVYQVTPQYSQNITGADFGDIVPGGSATFVRTDTVTQGTWQGVLGTDGYDLAQGPASLPAYAQVVLNFQSNYTWNASTTDARALQQPGASDRLAACWYAPASFSLDVNLTDGQTHLVGLYLLDWDKLGRTERIDVLDGNTGAVLDTRTVSGFSGGDYLVWTLGGHDVIRVTNGGSSPNAVVSGLFFGQTGQAGVTIDTATHGNWEGTYGTSGYALAPQGLTSLPAYVQLGMSGAQLPFTWSASTNDVRALQKPGAADRLAACWYNPGSFNLDLTFTDGKVHPVALYLLDWDNLGRSERVDVLDASNSNIVYSTLVNGFGGGKYLVWNLTGHVTLRVTNTGGVNAVASGLFIGQPGAPQLAAGGPAPGGAGLATLTDQALAPILAAAEDRWIATGLSAGQAQALRSVSALVADLPAGYLGRAALGGSVIYLDARAAGYGWFIDPTPMEDTEFPLVSAMGLGAGANSPAAGQMDLLTVVMHELGHVLHLDSVYGGDPADLMAAYLALGDRRLPSRLASGLDQSALSVEAGHESLRESFRAIETEETPSVLLRGLTSSLAATISIPPSCPRLLRPQHPDSRWAVRRTPPEGDRGLYGFSGEGAACSPSSSF